MKKYLDKKGIMSKYEEEMFENIVESCSKMYAEGKTWGDLEIFVEGIITYNEENYQRSTLFIKSLQCLKYSFIWAQEKSITDEDLLGKR